MLERTLDLLLRFPPAAVVAIVLLVPAVETGLIVGLIAPGEIAVVFGGVVASTGRVPLWLVAAASVAGPATGDIVGYGLGRRFGEAGIRKRLGKRWERTRKWLSREGIGSTFIARFIPFVRTVLPASAGAMRIPPGRFFPADLTAAATWGVGSTLLGYYAGRDWKRALALGDRFSVGIGAILAITIGVGLWLRRARRRRRRDAAPAKGSTRRGRKSRPRNRAPRKTRRAP
jgi:membrane-associated protein